MEFKGTKGKWKVTRSKNNHAYISGYSWGRFCKVYRTPSSGTEHQANVLLISKAPEMLEMLKSVLATEHLKGTIEESKIKQLIKQATQI